MISLPSWHCEEGAVQLLSWCPGGPVEDSRGLRIGPTGQISTQALAWVGRTSDVRYERLVIQAGSNSFSLELHPRLTVIAGVGQLERDGLIGEFIGAFG